MSNNDERKERIRTALAITRQEAMICTLPENVLLLSGYWPVVGTAVAVATATGQVTVLAPEDEKDLAAHGWADEVRTYQPGNLDSLSGPEQSVRQPLTHMLEDLEVNDATVGWETGSLYEPSSYSATYLFGASLAGILSAGMPDLSLTSGMDALTMLRSSLTPYEIGKVRSACQVAKRAFAAGMFSLRTGQLEAEVAASFSAPMATEGLAMPGVERAGAFTWCMSGPNSALAGAAYARTRDRALREGDFVLVHCNSYLDGYWTDITRTYCLGEPDDRKRAMYEAVFAAREAALESIRPGAAAAEVDGAARRVLSERGFGQYFTHGLGHNVGFSAISAEFPPRLHPASPDRLEVGMTFNVEPSIYIHGFGGLRHCDVVTVGTDGARVLTPFDIDPESLVIADS